MAADLSNFHTLNIADTCAVWNILSSNLLHQTAVSAGCIFSCTGFVNYECLAKPRKIMTALDVELQNRLRAAQSKGRFTVYHLEIADLIEVEVLESRKNLGKGELSSIAFAKRTNQAFLTDDQKARKLAIDSLGVGLTQTTVHLFGWLFYANLLGDADKDTILDEHSSLNRPLGRYFEDAYEQSRLKQLVDRT